MKRKNLRILILIFLTTSGLFLLPRSLNPAKVYAPSSNAKLEVLGRDLHSSNITSLALTPGTQFVVDVNVTGAGPLLGFDITLNYNMTTGPNLLQAQCFPSSNECTSPAADPLTGGMFDPAGTYPTGCGIFVSKDAVDQPPGRIRVGAVSQGGCPSAGTGRLLSITFNVIRSGAGTIDIVQYSQAGTPVSGLVGGVGNPPVAANVLYDPFNAYFRNAAGIPPLPSFTYPNVEHLLGSTVIFNATQTTDPDNPGAPNGGAQMEPIVYDSNNNQQYDTGEPVLVGATPAPGTRLGANPPYPNCHFLCNFNRPDPHVTFAVSGTNTSWVNGESIVYDASENGVFGSGDFVITGAAVNPGAVLKTDPLLTFVDAHLNNFWDNGYIWDWGDGSGLVNIGNVTRHIFQSAPATQATGKFQVKLVVYDSDNGLPNRQIQVLTVSPPAVNDISVTLALSRPDLHEGEPLGIIVSVSNQGDRPIADASLNVTYDLNNVTTISSVRGISLPLPGSQTFNYTLDTTPLTPGVYTVSALAQIIDPTTGLPIPNANPDNFQAQSFVLRAPLLSRDVGILFVSLGVQRTFSGQEVPIDVYVANLGTQPANFNVTVFYGSHLIENRTGISLPSDPSNPPAQDVLFIWNTTGVAPGTYTISATAYLLEDQNPANNHYTDGTVTLLPPPTITLYPSSGTVGSQVTVQGTGFSSTSLYIPPELEVTFDDQLLGFAFPSRGNFTFTFNVPVADPTKPHRIIVSPGPTGSLASAPFAVLPPRNSTIPLDVKVQVGSVYFPGDTAVIYVQTSLNGIAITPDSVQVSLALPNGAISTLQTTPAQLGLFKATFTIPSTAQAGTYVVWAKTHKAGSVDGVSLGVFEVKPSWVRGQGAMITGGVASIALVGVAVLTWQKGYLRKRPED